MWQVVAPFAAGPQTPYPVGLRDVMKCALALALSIGLQSLAVPASAAEPLVGLWRLQAQEIDGQRSDAQPMVLQISEDGDKLKFAFSVPMPDIYFVTTSYTVRLDGSSAAILNGNGQQMGTVQMTRTAAGHYSLTMKGPNLPESQGTLVVSPDGKMLVSEAIATMSGRRVHSKQTFARD
jgi:hypothetical protein